MAEVSHFDQEAAVWDEKPGMRELAEKVVQYVESRVTLRKEMACLDFGCGTGLVSFLLAPKVSEVVAFDGASGMIEMVKKKCHQVVSVWEVSPSF